MEREDVLQWPKNNDRLKRTQNDQLKMKRHFEPRDEILGTGVESLT